MLAFASGGVGKNRNANRSWQVDEVCRLDLALVENDLELGFVNGTAIDGVLGTV